MTTTTQRRRPAARKTRVGDEAASLPVADAVTDAVTDAGNEAATEAAARTEPGEAAEAVTPTVPTEPATPKPARKRASRAKAGTAAPVTTEAAPELAAAAEAAPEAAAEPAAPVPAPKKRPARKRATAAEVHADTEASTEAVAPTEAAASAETEASTESEASTEADASTEVEVVATESGESAAPRKGRRKPKVEPAVEAAPAVPAEPPRFTLGAREDDGVFGDYELRDGLTGATCRLRLLGRQTWRCDCAGYRAQGTCEHGEHLLALFDGAQQEALDAGWPAREAEVWLVPGPQRRLQWVCGREVPDRLREQDGLDEQLRRSAEGAHAWLQELLSEARSLGVVLRVDAPVWPQLACGRDAQARVQRIEAAMADGAAMRALLRDELPVHAWEAALFAVCAGRALVADDLGLGQRGAAIAAIRLWGECFGVKPAVVIAPEAAHAAWRRDLTRWLGEEAKSVTVTATPPAKPQAALLVVDGIESVDSERLAALRAVPAEQLLLIAHQEPLADARLVDWIDWLDDMRRGPLARLRALPEDAGKKLKREALESVLLSRRKRELADQLPAALLSPMWLDGAGANGASLPAAPLKQLRQLTERWTALRFLSSAEQQQLLEALSLLPPASRQALAAKAEAVLALRREWIQGAVPAAARLVVCARSETLLDSLSMSPQLRRLPPQRLRAGDAPVARAAALSAWRSAEAGVLLASDDALGSLPGGALAEDRVALVHADLPWQPAVLAHRVEVVCGDEACGVPAALLLIEDSLDAAVLRAQRDGVSFPDWLDAAPAWLEGDQLDALMAVLPTLLEGL
ncbi:hypothetical protein [Roseateles sp.]|uniref:hypothetical protein n=1 Tax=Roseateles sp. TaxID=1971397 RepID=UPI0031E277EC